MTRGKIFYQKSMKDPVGLFMRTSGTGGVMNNENKALKEIEESIILTNYLIHFNISMEDIKHFTSKYVKRAIEWDKNGRL